MHVTFKKNFTETMHFLIGNSDDFCHIIFRKQVKGNKYKIQRQL